MTGYSKMFWGFILVLFTIRISNVDVLPGFVGFLLIHSALGDLAGTEPGFAHARKFTIPLLVISLFFFIQFDLGLLTMVLAVVYAVLTLLMLWYICRAISNLAASVGNLQLQQAAEARWKYYLVVTMFTLASPLLLFLGPILLVLIIAGFAVSVLLLMMFHQAGQVLRQG